MEYQIQTTSARNHLAILSLLYSLGYKYHWEETAEKAAKKYSFEEFPWLVLYPDSKTIEGNFVRKGAREITIDEFLKLEDKPTEYTFKVGEYNVVLTKERVKFGCQEFNWGDVEVARNALNNTDSPSFNYRTKNWEDFQVAEALVRALGWDWGSFGRDLRGYYNEGYTTLTFYPTKKKRLTAFRGDGYGHHCKTLGELVTFLTTPITHELSNGTKFTVVGDSLNFDGVTVTRETLEKIASYQSKLQ